MKLELSTNLLTTESEDILCITYLNFKIGAIKLV